MSTRSATLGAAGSEPPAGEARRLHAVLLLAASRLGRVAGPITVGTPSVPKRRASILVLAGFTGAVVVSLLFPVLGHAACGPEPITAHTPTGISGCVVYGEGVASRWTGPGVARNDCVWPWTSCAPISITSLETGRSLTITPTMYCDCYTGTSSERIVDLDPAAVAALGLAWAQGLYPVRVEPVSGMPDTAMPS